MTEEQVHEPTPISAPEAQNELHYKTLAVRVEEGLHAQLRFIAQLSGSSLSDEIRTALEARVTAAKDDPTLIERAEQARQEIERSAAVRTAALAGFIGKPATQASVTGKGRRGAKPSEA